MTRAVLTTSGAQSARPVLLLRLAGIFLLACLTGCAGRDGRKILTSANGYDKVNGDYTVRCVTVVGRNCGPCYSALKHWRKSLDDASEAYKRGGKLPDQMAALQAAEKDARAACSK